jgi:glycosyltransferase involved in cell wall biosynthesis
MMALQTYETSPLIAILLCTYNGQAYLREQLDSLELQTYKNWVLYTSDDGSLDNTLEILKEYQRKWGLGKLFIRNGPQKGFCQNFLKLACDSEIKANYYAFCDQDDIWMPRKLEISLKTIISNEIEGRPFLYCGRTCYVDDSLKVIGVSPLFVFPKNFQNALVQSIAGGNTMMFNDSTRSILKFAGPVEVASHDWWLYQLVTGVDGDVFYDLIPQVLYRQHLFALVGGNNSFRAKLIRLIQLLQGRFRRCNEINLIALTQIKEIFTKRNQETLTLFGKIRCASVKDRIRLMGVCGLFRQTRGGTISLFLAIIFNKI